MAQKLARSLVEEYARESMESLANPSRQANRFLVDEAGLDRIAEIVARCWPEAIAPEDLGRPGLWADVTAAREALFARIGLAAG